MFVDRGGDLAVEVERRLDLRAIEVRDVGFVDGGGFRAPVDVARVRREQLVDRGERSCKLGQVEELDLHAVDERVEGVHRPAIRRAERDERSRVAPAVEAFEEVA